MSLGNGLWVALRMVNSRNILASSFDILRIFGNLWWEQLIMVNSSIGIQRTSSFTNYDGINSIGYNDGLWIIVGNGGKLATSRLIGHKEQVVLAWHIAYIKYVQE